MPRKPRSPSRLATIARRNRRSLARAKFLADVGKRPPFSAWAETA